jgi:hypothetical protein
MYHMRLIGLGAGGKMEDICAASPSGRSISHSRPQTLNIISKLGRLPSNLVAEILLTIPYLTPSPTPLIR